MIIVFEHHTDVNGNVVAVQFLDTGDPAVITMLTTLKASVAAQVTAGYGVTCKVPAYSGMTRWQAVLGEVVRLNDSAARTALGV